MKKISKNKMLEMMKLKKNSDRLKILNTVVDRVNKKKFILDIYDSKYIINIDDGKTGQKQLDLYKKMDKAGLIKYQVNNLNNAYYQFYSTLIVGNDEATLTAENIDIDSLYMAYNTDLFKTHEPSTLRKIKLVDGSWINQPLKVFETVEEMQEYHQKLKDMKKALPKMKEEAFRNARINMHDAVYYKIKNQKYYDDLYYFKFLQNYLKKAS